MKKTKTPIKLSEMAGVDQELFANRNPSEELKKMRVEWTEEFDRRIKRL